MDVEMQVAPQPTAGPDERAGAIYGFLAYLLWGSFPLFFLLLARAGPVEILAHRIVWSLVAVAVILVVRRNLAGIIEVVRDRRRLGLMAAAALLIGLNWGVFIYAVNSDHVIEGSLGYFITPIVSAAFGVMVFRERLRPRQLAALGLGLVAVLVLTVDYGRLPWVALTLALSFGTYGLVKKIAGVGAAESLAIETLLLLIPAIAYLIALEVSGNASFGHEGTDLTLLLIACGPVTAVPLLLFGAAVTRTRLTIMAMLQYITPVLQFLVGLLVQDEAMPTSRWVGFALVWLALLLLSIDGLHHARRSRVMEPALERA
jgi:chloramphenicol-sensitive protein RarD